MPKNNLFNLARSRDGRNAMKDLLAFVENKGGRKKAYAGFLFLVMNSVGADSGAMWLYDTFGGSRLNCIVENGHPEYPVRTLLLGEGVPGAVVEKGEPCLQDDGKRLCIPIMAQNAVFGAVDLFAPANDGFLKRDEDLSLSISTALAETIVSHSETLILGYHSLEHPQSGFYSYQGSAVIETLASIIEARSEETGQHSMRMKHFTRLVLGEVSRRNPFYELTKDRIELISDAATLHDIGKIAISDSILNKPGKLTAEEFENVKQHSLIGERLVSKLRGSVSTEYLRYACEICSGHHERWDGKGYPLGLKGDEIPVWAQCVGLIDAYDALISKRSYKLPYSHDTAVEMICGGQCGAFSPELLDAFRSVSSNINEMAAVLSDDSE